MFVARKGEKSTPVYLLWYTLHIAAVLFLSYFLPLPIIENTCLGIHYVSLFTEQRWGEGRADCRQTASSFELWAVANFTFHSNPVHRLCVPWESDRNKSRPFSSSVCELYWQPANPHYCQAPLTPVTNYRG